MCVYACLFLCFGFQYFEKKKIFSGNNLSSGTRYYSHFFFTLDLPRNLSAQALLLCRKVRTKKKVHVSLWLDMTSFPVEASRMQVFHKELQHGRKGAVIPWHCLRYSVNTSVMIELPPVPSPKSKDKNQAALHAHTATTCKKTHHLVGNRIHKRVASKDLPQPLAPGR